MMSEELKEILHGIARSYQYDSSLIIDVSPGQLVQEMDEAGIDKTVLLSLDPDIFIKSIISYKDYNNYLADIVKKYSDRFIGFAGIDPRRGKEAIVELKRCVQDLGLSGVKLWPLTGFYPDDIKFYPFYECVEDLGVPILCHTGTGPAGSYMKYNRPVYIDKVAVDFPKIKIIMAHIGNPWTNEAIAIAGKNPNVYFDISAWEVALKNAPVALFQTLLQAKMACGVEKILFGSDWPIFTPIMSLKKWVKGIKKMKIPAPLQLMGLPDLTEEEKNMILGGNAAKVLGL